MAMKVLAQKPLDDTTADAQLVSLGAQSEIEGKNLIVMRNLQYQLDALAARVEALENP